MGPRTEEDSDNVWDWVWQQKEGAGGGAEKEEPIRKVSSDDYSSSPGKMQARSGQSCEAGRGVKVGKENELERLTEAILQKPMTGFDP